jgi:hypothetical protein
VTDYWAPPPSPQPLPWTNSLPTSAPPQYWSPVPPKRSRTGLIVGVCAGAVALLVVGVLVVPALLVRNQTHVAQSESASLGAYTTFDGPTGKPFPTGRPWGVACQPVRLTVEEHVPDDVYAQVVTVVKEARADGINVTVEDRTFSWNTGSLYYPAGMTPDNVQRVGIFVNNGAPDVTSDGQPEHVKLGWDATLDADGQHEDMTDAQGELQMANLTGDAVGQRRAVREVIALTQGVSGTNDSGSGLGPGSTHDGFSAADIGAMKQMSGCGDAPASVVEHSPI